MDRNQICMDITLGPDEDLMFGDIALMFKVRAELNISKLSICGGENMFSPKPILV